MTGTVRVAQDTTFAGTTAPTQRARPSARPGRLPVILRAAQARAHPGYDRVVFEFSGDSLPGYHIEYTTRPVVRCGSGDPVTVAGSGWLRVRFDPARAHDEQGASSIAEREAAPALPAVQELKLVCDFEGQVEWVLGAAAALPYRVVEAHAPSRLILDVRHP